jgi:hypothetical protein
MLQQHILYVVCDGSVFLRSKDTDFVKNFIGQSQGENTLVSCHTIPPVEQVLTVLYSFSETLYAFKEQLSDSILGPFSKNARGADAPFGFFEEKFAPFAHFRGRDEARCSAED